jgi:hypothetical protein
MIAICGAAAASHLRRARAARQAVLVANAHRRLLSLSLPGTTSAVAPNKPPRRRGSGLGQAVISAGSILVGIGFRAIGVGIGIWAGLSVMRWAFGFLSTTVAAAGGLARDMKSGGSSPNVSQPTAAIAA